MILHRVRAFKSAENLPHAQQLAWQLAGIATEKTPLDADVIDMIGNRIIDNAAVAVASLNRAPIVAARTQALANLRIGGAALFGLPHDVRVNVEWAAWANGVAVRELDFHDTFLAADYSHPADNIPPILAVAQTCAKTGAELLQAIATAYEIHVALVKGICLHEHKIDHIAHLGVAAAAGIGTLLDLPREIIYQAIQQVLHTTTQTRQSRKGEISNWKACAPGFAGKMAIEAIDRAMRGETSPSPIYEGEDGFIAWLLGGFGADYQVPLPARGAPKRAILETYTKEHSAEYQAQAIIDLARKLRPLIGDFDAVKEVVLYTSHHTHHVIGTGANDPQKMDPAASRETLDHSIMYILAVALQDGAWHHEKSYAPERAQRADTVALWHKIRTVEDDVWTQRYHAASPSEKAFGGRLEIIFNDGHILADELKLADAHPNGARPFVRADYQRKFNELAGDIVGMAEQARFFELVKQLPQLTMHDVLRLQPVVPPDYLKRATLRGIFDYM